MGSQDTPSGSYLFGLARPVAWAATVPGEYDEADPVPGRDSTDAERVRLELRGSPSYLTTAGATAVPLSIEAKQVAVSEGPPAGSWVWRRNATGAWFGQDVPAILTRYDVVSSVGASYTATAPSAIELQSGGVLVAWGEVHASTGAHCYVRRRDGHLWTEAEVDIDQGEWLMTANPDTLPTSLVQLADGSILLLTICSEVAAKWTLHVFRSLDDGDTWQLHSYGAITWTSAPRVLRATLTAGGLVAVWASVGSGSATTVSSWWSLDAVTWTQVDNGVGSAQSGLVVWDARTIRDSVHLLVEWGGGASGASSALTLMRAVDVMTTSVTSVTTGTVIVDLTGDEVWISGGSLADEVYGDGLMVASYSTPTGIWRVPGTGTATLRTPFDGAGGQLAQGQAVWWRGSLCLIATRRETVTISGDVTEVRVGGQGDVTWTRDYGVYGVDYMPTGWVAVDGNLSTVWATTDSGGTSTRTYSRTTGQRIQTDGATTTYNEPSFGSPRVGVVMSARLRVPTGTGSMRVRASDATNYYGVIVEITSTQIRAYDETGAASSYQSHGAATGDFLTVEVTVSVEGGAGSARMFWEASDVYPRARSGQVTVSGLSGTAGTSTRARLQLAPSGDMYVLWAWAASRDRVLRWPTPSRANPYDVLGIPLSASERRPFADGLTARVQGAPAFVDGEAHRVTMTSATPRSHADAYVSGSPRKVWRMSSASAQVVRFTPASGTADAWHGAAVWVLYLAGLHNVPQLVITSGAYASAIPVDLRTPLTYTTEGWTVRPAESGSTVVGQWVGHDELVGCQMQLHGGAVRRVVSNTAGSLTSGTPAEHRAVLTLDGDASSAGSGYLWPRDAAAIVLVEGDHGGAGEWVITIAAGGTLPSGESYREIGVIHLAPLAVGGIAPDLTEGRETTIGDELQELPGGDRYAARLTPNRPRVDVAWATYPHDVSGQVGPSRQGAIGPISGGSPNYFAIGGSSGTIAGPIEPTQVMASLVAATGRKPTVAVSCIPTSGYPDGGVAVVAPAPWRQGVYYGRIQGNPRTERIPGQDERVQMVRMLALTIEGEV